MNNGDTWDGELFSLLSERVVLLAVLQHRKNSNDHEHHDNAYQKQK